MIDVNFAFRHSRAVDVVGFFLAGVVASPKSSPPHLIFKSLSDATWCISRTDLSLRVQGKNFLGSSSSSSMSSSFISAVKRVLLT